MILFHRNVVVVKKIIPTSLILYKQNKLRLNDNDFFDKRSFKMKKIILISAAALALSACISTELSTQNKTYDPTQDARIRLYGQNGRPTTLIIDPHGKAEKVTVGGGAGQAFSSLLHLKGNESIGMPESSFSKAPEQFNNIGSGAFYKEFIIPANVEIALQNTINTPPHIFNNVATGKTTVTQYHCGSGDLKDALIFKAEAGKDYEATPPASTSKCGIELFQLN